MNYTIQMAAKISNVGVHTIRIWERRYKAVCPPRDEAGYRLYSKKDVEKLSLLNELCHLGFSISKIAGLDNETLKSKLIEHSKSLSNLSEFQLDKKLTEIELDQSITITLMALKAYNLDIVSKELARLRQLLSGRQFAMDVVLPLMSELGGAVEKGDYSIAHEHALSAIVKFHLGYFLYKTPENKKISNHKIIICGVAGDEHEFGILIAAVLCQHYGFDFYYMGANLPVESLLDACQFLEADMIVIGVTDMSVNLDMEDINQYIDQLLKKSKPEMEVIFGGSRNVNVKPQYQNRFSQLHSLEEFDLLLKDIEF